MGREFFKKARLTAAAFVLAMVLAPSYAHAEFDQSVYHYGCGCDEIAAGRSQDICTAISNSLEWHWFNHGIIAPGFRTTKEGIAKVYADMGINTNDVATLQALKKYGRDYDWRLEDGVDGLVRILNIQTGGHFMEDQAVAPISE